MESSFKIDQELTFSEYYRSALYYFNNKKLKIYLLIIYIVPFISDLFALATIPNFKFDYSSIYIGLGPFILFFLVVLIVVLISCSYFYYTKPQYFKNISYSFTHWGVIRTSETLGFSKPWREFIKFKETADFFLLYVSARDFHVVQKRKFETNQDILNFRNLLKEKIGNK